MLLYETLYVSKQQMHVNWTMRWTNDFGPPPNNFLQYISPSVIYEEGNIKVVQSYWKFTMHEKFRTARIGSEVVKINTAWTEVSYLDRSVQKFDDT